MKFKIIVFGTVVALCIVFLFILLNPWHPGKNVRSLNNGTDKGTRTLSTDEAREAKPPAETGESLPDESNPIITSQEAKEQLSPTSVEKREWVVKDCFGKPVASARIRAVRVSDQIRKEYLDSGDYDHYPFEVKETLSDASGRFSFDDLAPGTYLLHGDAPGHGHGHALLDLTGPAPEQFTLSLTLEKVIRGRVLDIHKKPLEGVLVEISRPYLPFENLYSIPPEDAVDIVYFHLRQKTDGEGWFEIAGLPSKDLIITVEEGPTEGYSKVIRWIDELEEDEQIIYLRKACTLRGRILDEKGKPIHKAFIRPIIPQTKGPDLGNYTFSDEDGRYRFDDIREGTNYIQVSHENYGNQSGVVEILPDRDNVKDFVLPNGFKKTFEIRDERGQPIPGISVSIYDSNSGADLCILKTDDKGQVTIYYLVKGRRIIADVNTFNKNKKYLSKEITFIVQDDAPLVITLKKPIKMHFRCFDAVTRKPIPKVCSCLFEPCLLERRRPPKFLYKYFDGQEIYWGLPKDSISFNCWFFAPGYEPYCFLLSKGTFRADPPYDVYLKPGKKLAGTVLDSVHLTPVAEATVRLIPVSPVYDLPVRTGQITHNAVTDGEGRFVLEGVPSSGNDYRLEVFAPGYPRHFVEGAVLRTGTEPTGNTVLLRPGSTLTGTVRDEAGRPVESYIVQAYDPEGPRLAMDQVDVGGPYLLRGLPAGRIVVEMISCTDGWIRHHHGLDFNPWFQRKTVKLTPGKKTVLDFVLRGRAWITGTVTRGGVPLPGVLLQVLDPESGSAKTICIGYTTDYGNYSLSPIPPGRKIVRVKSQVPGVGFSTEKDILVPEEGRVDVDFDLSEARFQGTVRDEKGQGIPGCWLTLTNSEKQKTCTAYTDMEGKFTFFDVPEGPCTLSIAADGYAQKQDEVVLTAAKPLNRDYTLAAEGKLELKLKLPSNKLAAGTKAVVVEPEGYTGKTASNGAGFFVFQNFQDGTPVTVLAGGAGYAPAAVSSVVHTGETVEEEVLLPEGGWLEVRARTKEGKPIQGAKVVPALSGLLGLSWAKLLSAGFLQADPGTFTTSKEGSFRIGPLPPGNYPVTVFFQGTSWNGEAAVAAGKTGTVQAVF